MALKHPVQSVEKARAVREVRGVVERLDVGRHALVGEGLLAVLVGDLDVPFTVHQVFHIDGGDLESFDGVGSCHSIRGKELAQARGPLGFRADLVAQQGAHPLNVLEDSFVVVGQCGCGVQHEAMMW
ncbi:hypothetical protein ACFYWH_38580 [Streptomyces sp. NPDC003737]|uniref:hypothetical protein n=1 Tax=Streptomyces sp. NPDC003737 TaxID=3364685 RepID=UPI00369700EB